MKKTSLFAAMFILVAIVLVAIPGGHVSAQDTCTESYVVQPGDTLAIIAQEKGVTIQYLMTVNGIVDPDLIIAGQPICLRQSISPPVPTPTAQGLGAVEQQPVINQQPASSSDSGPSFAFGFDENNEKAKDLTALDPAHRGTWEPIHWFLLIPSIILVVYNLRVRWNGSKLDLIGAFACIAFAFGIVFVSCGVAGMWPVAVLYLVMIVLSFVGDDDFSSFGLMCLLTAIIASFFGKASLFGINESVALRSIQDIPTMWESLDFTNMTLSAVIYGNLAIALVIFSRELWAELVQVGKAARNMNMPSNWNEFLGDGANTLFTFTLILIWGFF